MRGFSQYGEEAIKEGMGGGGGPGGMADIFDMFMGGGGRGRSGTRERKSEDVLHKLSVSLEDMYNGTTRYAVDIDTSHVKAFADPRRSSSSQNNRA